MIHPDNGILFRAKKRNELSNYEQTWRKLKCMLPSERSQTEKVTYCMVPTIQHSGKGYNKKISGCQGLEWGKRWVGRAQRMWGVVKVLYMILYCWIHVIIYLSKLIKCTTPTVNLNVTDLNVNYGLGVIMMCQCRFINCNKVPLWWEMLVIGEAVHEGGREHMGNLCAAFSILLWI